MYFKDIQDITDSSLEELRNSGCLLVFIADKSKAQANSLIAFCNQHGLKIFGGIYPSIIQGTTSFEDGFLMIQIPEVEYVLKFDNLDESNFPKIANLEDVRTALLLTDGLMTQTDSFLRKIYGVLGSNMNIVGGGAGSLSLRQEPCLFTNEGLFQNGAVVALLKTKSKIGVKHGWKAFAGPFIATSTEKNIIKELNWQPAFEVYKKVIESNSSVKFTEKNFTEIARTFPFGIYKEGAEFIVRDPFVVNDNNEIICISDIPENSTLQILTGYPETLIEAAKHVAESTLTRENLSNLMIFDCISRVLYLDERFEDELQAIQEVYNSSICNIRGVATLGEIASTGTGFVDFYNKTIVAACLYN
jgi:hypothetical protein